MTHTVSHMTHTDHCIIHDTYSITHDAYSITVSYTMHTVSHMTHTLSLYHTLHIFKGSIIIKYIILYYHPHLGFIIPNDILLLNVLQTHATVCDICFTYI